MKLAFVEIANFRKLLSVRIDLAEETTLLVGANNSGKTSAMIALRRFLTQRKGFRLTDFTLAHWKTIEEIGRKWEGTPPQTEPSDELETWQQVYPSMDLWLDVSEGEFHYVSTLLPALDWQGGLLGIRLQLEPKEMAELRNEFLKSLDEANRLREGVPVTEDGSRSPRIWPESLLAFLERRFSHFQIKAYALDPTKLKPPIKGKAEIQRLPADSLPLDGDPLERLIRINEIRAQRGFGDTADAAAENEHTKRAGSRKLTEQLKSYFSKHLDPQTKPTVEDLRALIAIDEAEDAFDKRLESSFLKAFAEVRGIGYPGVSDPRLRISTRLRPIDGLSHESAVTYEIDMMADNNQMPLLRLPEECNGLGYQNLISMTFELLSFRDEWLRVGKAKRGTPGSTKDDFIEPLHLVLVEEPEAHLHAQVQQVFIKKAYQILTDAQELKGDTPFRTQVIVSTHSSHVAHETSYSSVRYFRRLPAGLASVVPVSAVHNMTTVFGGGNETKRFETRYLKANHCDLFFADAAILIEGPTERMLVPHFIRQKFPFLNQCYISLLEIGGSHAHRLRPLLEQLGILTLVITDLDSGKDGKSIPTRRNDQQTTNNPTLRDWLPALTSTDQLLDATEDQKIREQDALACVRVAYQLPISWKDGNPLRGDAAATPDAQGEALPSTFEDSLVLTNPGFFASLPGTGLAAKFRDALTSGKGLDQIAEDLYNALRNGKKAEFALDVIDAQNFENLEIPIYIAGGLTWLEARLKKRQAEVLDNPAIAVEEATEA